MRRSFASASVFISNAPPVVCSRARAAAAHANHHAASKCPGSSAPREREYRQAQARAASLRSVKCGELRKRFQPHCIRKVGRCTAEQTSIDSSNHYYLLHLLPVIAAARVQRPQSFHVRSKLALMMDLQSADTSTPMILFSWPCSVCTGDMSSPSHILMVES